jgi:hypothetical protein
MFIPGSRQPNQIRHPVEGLKMALTAIWQFCVVWVFAWLLKIEHFHLPKMPSFPRRRESMNTESAEQSAEISAIS